MSYSAIARVGIQKALGLVDYDVLLLGDVINTNYWNGLCYH